MVNVNLIGSSDNNKRGLERTGRIGGNARNSVNQYDLTESDIMVPKPVVNPNSLSVRIKLD
jgi:hypothetical protein